MAKLEFEFVGFYDCDRYITVNGKFVKFEKTEKKTYTCNVETIDDKCEVMVYQPHKYTGKHWLLWNLMFFIISLFGLFDIRDGIHFHAYNITPVLGTCNC